MRDLPLALEAPPADRLIARLLDQIGERSLEVGKVEVPFKHLAPPDGQMWTGDASEEVRVPLGRAGATKLQKLSLGRGTSQHVLIAGKTGSGKSTLLHVLIANMGLWFSPDEVEFYLVDFKKGVEFKAYAGAMKLPHVRVVAIESDREFGLSVLHRVDDGAASSGRACSANAGRAGCWRGPASRPDVPPAADAAHHRRVPGVLHRRRQDRPGRLAPARPAGAAGSGRSACTSCSAARR